MQHDNMSKIGDMLEGAIPSRHLSLVKSQEQEAQPYVVNAFVVDEKPPLVPCCSQCMFPLSETAHGWVRDFSKHFDHVGHNRKFDYCEIPCPSCSSSAMERSRARKQEENVSRLFGSSNIPHHARKWTFESIPTDADQNALAFVRAFVQGHLAQPDSDEKRGLWLAGAPGRCKTGIAVSVLQEAIRHNETVLFVMTIELLNKLRSSFGKNTDYTEDEVLATVSSVKWLVLDDIATERPTAYVLEQFYYIIEKRRSQGLYTIFTSNLSTRDLEKHWRPEGVAEGAFHAGVRVLERIKESCTGLPVRGRNQREKDW